MNEDMNDIEKLLWIELRHGMTKTVSSAMPSNEEIEKAETQLVEMLTKHRESLKIASPLPKIRTWVTQNKINFMFFDRKTNRRVLLGEWLSNRGIS